MELDYILYVLEGNYKLEELTSKNVDKYNKIIELINTYKESFLELNKAEQTTIFKYILSKLDKRVKFNTVYENNNVLSLLLKLYRDIEFTGATALEISNIEKEFNNYHEIERQLEEMKVEGYFEIESRGDLFQIRFSAINETINNINTEESEKQEIKENLINMYNENKYFMNLKDNTTITPVQLDNWLEFRNYVIDKDLIRIYNYDSKQVYSLIENKINDIDKTVNEIYIRQQKENIKQSEQYKTLDNYRRYCYKIKNLFEIKISEILHSKKNYVSKLIDKEKILNKLNVSRKYWIDEDRRTSEQINELLRVV